MIYVHYDTILTNTHPGRRKASHALTHTVRWTGSRRAAGVLKINGYASAFVSVTATALQRRAVKTAR